MPKSRGGKRPGAGRKKTGIATTTITLRVTPELKSDLRTQAQLEGVSIRQLLEDMLYLRVAEPRH